MENLDGNTEMSDAFADDGSIAKSLIEMIAGDAWDGKGAALEAVYAVLSKAFPLSKWTRRRVKGLYQLEAASVAFREMRELAVAAVAAESKHEKLRKAREEHAQYIAETTHLAAMALGRSSLRSGQARPE